MKYVFMKIEMSHEWHIDLCRFCRCCLPTTIFFRCDIVGLRLKTEASILDSLHVVQFSDKRKNSRGHQMPFMKGKAPIRRTLNYLQKGKLAIKNPIKIFTLNYNYIGEQNLGAKDFAFWYLPQIQFKNPDVQILAVRNLTPTPFIRCFFGKKFIHSISFFHWKWSDANWEPYFSFFD